MDRKTIKAMAANRDLPVRHNTNQLSPNPESIFELGSRDSLNIMLNIYEWTK